ncbi:hypothetical protein GNI_160100, partial [Gregarina niphandrodes]
QGRSGAVGGSGGALPKLSKPARTGYTGSNPASGTESPVPSAARAAPPASAAHQIPRPSPPACEPIPTPIWPPAICGPGICAPGTHVCFARNRCTATPDTPPNMTRFDDGNPSGAGCRFRDGDPSNGKPAD